MIEVNHPRWTLRLQQQLPIGTDEAALVSELRKEGFRVGISMATYKWTDVVCDDELTVIWRIDEKRKIADISGGYVTHCL